jgi:hypothetical protein
MKPLSFSQRLNAGWSKADLMRYFALDEKQYEKVLVCLQSISINNCRMGEKTKTQ